MVYIYDILLNFNKNLIEYFEWEETDKIKYVKKITLLKTNKEVLTNFITKEVELEESFIKTIPKYEMDGTNNKKSVCLFTDGFIVIGVVINKNKIESYSRLLLDEEREALEIAETINEITINYKINKDKETKKELLTRKEKNIKEQLQEEIEKKYINKEESILLYLYYEYTGKETKHIERAYKYLITSLSSLNEKHFHLYQILELTKNSQV